MSEITTPTGVDFDEAWALIERQAPRENSGLRHVLFAANVLGATTEEAIETGRQLTGRPLTREVALGMVKGFPRKYAARHLRG